MSGNHEMSLMYEEEELLTVKTLVLESFNHCEKMQTDILEYSSDIKNDFIDLKKITTNLAEMAKSRSALVDTLEVIESKIDLDGTDEKKIPEIFDDVYDSILAEKGTNKSAEKIINAIDAYFDNETVASGDNDELQVTSTQESFKDPITKLPIKDPVLSNICNHSFERKTILEYLKKHHKCPYSGCGSSLTGDDLIEDLALKRKLLSLKQTGE
ncbi:hypothetical protein CDAR_490411 [Caerostris darwini]|uniref:E3 SUMO-protein ligase NSE2 n=1 Tax=Caerostris darwini TaxID=1538125 RepID=A0AAV4NNJ3_9ARAC|nr:hypothetical protein CDAR_490411 [Caerostris darwini]